MPALIYGRLPYRLLKGEVDLDAGQVRAALAGAYDANLDMDDRFSHVVEASGPGYIPGGLVVQNFTLEYDAATNRTLLLGDDPNYPTLSLPVISGVVFYLDDANSLPLLAYHRFVTPRAVTNAPFTYHLTNRTIAQFQA